MSNYRRYYNELSTIIFLTFVTYKRRYYDHIIRNENDLNRHLDYIHYNSIKHYHISPKDWKYSSFEKFVNLGFYDDDWCNFGDKNLICELDLE